MAMDNLSFQIGDTSSNGCLFVPLSCLVFGECKYNDLFIVFLLVF